MRTTAATVAVLALLLAGCSGPSTIEPQTGPLATPDAPTASSKASSPPATKATPTAKPTVATFKDQQVYGDGVRVEVTKIKHAKLTKLDTEVYDSKAKAGAPYVDFHVRVMNKTKNKLALSTSESVTYGPDGDEGEEVYVGNAPGDISGTLLPGKSRLLHIQYVIPNKYQGDVVMEFTFDEDHDATVFSGSVK